MILTDLAFFGLDDTRAIGADQARLRLLPQCILDLGHILLRNALRDAYYQWHLVLQQYQGGSIRSRDRRHANESG